jgi:hypothetical protein
VKARAVKGLKPDGWLAENARRIVLVRLDELTGFGEASRDPAKVEELHDMRIAAKRLRYVLEIHEPLFGFTAGRAARTVRDLQDLLGQIHDCDEMIPMVRRHARSLRREDVEAMRAAAGEGAEDLEPAAAGTAPNARHYRGLESLLAYLRARRVVLHERFVRRWDELERHDFAGKLEWDIERATAKAMAEVSERERREAAEREAARAAEEARRQAAEMERAAEELERRAAEESQRMAAELEQRVDGEDEDNATATTPEPEPSTMDPVVAETTSADNGSGEPPIYGLRN